jgi:hypothetical protein
MGKKSKGKKEQKKEIRSIARSNYDLFFKFLPLVLLFVLTIILFNQFVFSDQMLYGTDTLEAGVMFRSFYVNFVKQYHQIPMWDPYLFGGLPFVDAMHGDTFYPLAVLQFFLPIYRALGWKLVLTVFLAGLFAYLCLRVFGFNRMVSFLGALAYMFSTNLVSFVYGGHEGRMYIISILPLLFLFVEKALNTKKIIYYLGLGFSIGLLILANHPQLAYYALWALGLYFLFRLGIMLKETKADSFVQRIKPIVPPILLFVLAVIVGLLLAMVQVLPPTIYVNKYSPRAGGRGYEYATSWSAHPEELVSQVVPEFAGLNVQEENSYWGRNPFKLNSDYGGIISLILALLALFLVKEKKIWFFLGLSLLALIYSLGAHTPLYRLFYWLVPQVKNFRAPSLILFLFDFSIIFLACFGIQKIMKGLKSEHEKKRLFKFLKILVILFLVLAFLFTVAGGALLSIWNGILYNDISPTKKAVLAQNLPNMIKGFWLSFILVGLLSAAIYLLVKEKIKPSLFVFWLSALIVLDLWRMDFKFIKDYDYFSYFREDRAIEFLKKNPEPFRTLDLPGTYPGQDFLAFYGIDQVFGYHGNQLKIYDDFTERKYLEEARTREEYQQRYAQFIFGNKVDLLNTEYFLSRKPFEHPKFKQVFEGDGIYVFQNLAYLPRARIVFKYEVIKDREKILPRIKDPGFDYRNSIILEEEPEVSLSLMDTSTAEGKAWIEKDEINSFEVEAELSQPGFLVLSENYYPAWKAYVDGKETKIYKADYLFRTVYLDKGKHQIRFIFDSIPYKIGKTSTLLTSLLLLVILIFYLTKGYVFKKSIRQPTSTG